MKLKLPRGKPSANSTIGRLLVDDAFQCWTLEDIARPIKIPGNTAIPAGTYKVIITESNRFKRRLPLLVDVPGFAGIRIHPGNCATDTEGCILVGTSYSTDWVSNSRVAFDKLFALLDAAEPGSIEITITDAKG